MKKKILILLFIAIHITACKKDKQNNKVDLTRYTFTDEKITPSEIAANFMTRVDGCSFTIGANGFEGGVNGESADSNSKQSHIDINGRIFTPAPQPALYGNYYVPNYYSNSQKEINDLFSFFKSVSEGKTTNFTLFDKENKPLIKFVMHNPTPINLTIDNKIYRNAPIGSRIVLHWNASPDNKLGVAIALSGDNGLRYLYFEDKGIADVTDDVLAVARHDRISLTITRGVILIGKGTDNRYYKLSNRIGKTEIVYI